jgi:ribosomal protein S18 acetylase RimI-like enzyme
MTRAGGQPLAVTIACNPMTRATLGSARTLLLEFLGDDDHYRASAAAYGDGGAAALDRALELFLARPDLGFVWLAVVADRGAAPQAAGACVVCYAISTARGSLVAKLDDVTIASRWRARGIGSAMIGALAEELARRGVTRIDCGCHRDNAAAWRFYGRLGFVPLHEERLALLLPASMPRGSGS